jgi:hypothetical protein
LSPRAPRLRASSSVRVKVYVNGKPLSAYLSERD